LLARALPPALLNRDLARAKWTIDTLLRLNREPLPQARQQAFEGYEALLHKYVTDRVQAASPAPQRLKEAIQRNGHRFVWEEMKTQRAHFHELRALFEQAPEALEWPALPWGPNRQR
jgi:hypothetical protein